MIEKILIKNGFSTKEARVYLAILEYGESTASMISKKAKVERSTVYDVVSDLKNKGLVFVQDKKSVRHFSALSPEILIERFRDNLKRAESIMPDLISMAYSSPIKPRTKFYEGINGLKQVLRDFSHSNENSYLFTDYKKMPEELRDFLWEEVIPERKKRDSFARLIVPNNKANREESKKDKARFGEHRMVEFPISEVNPLELSLYGTSTVAFISYSKNEMFAFTINSLAIHSVLKNIFWLIWNNTRDI